MRRERGLVVAYVIALSALNVALVVGMSTSRHP